MPISAGIHHVTAVCSDPRRNLAFFRDVLGLRFVKRTVNFDDPHTWHLYYGDTAGSPGTALTFFPWPDLPRARSGFGYANETAFSIPASSVSWWLGRLAEKGVQWEQPEKRFDELVIPFRDPDHMALTLVARADDALRPGWGGDGVPAGHAIRGFDGVTLWMRDAAPSAALLEGAFGYARAGSEGDRTRWITTGGGRASRIDIREARGFIAGRLGAGGVHHVAFRAESDAAQAAMRDVLAADHGVAATEQRDRNYFRSIYFREPSGVLFEIATDDPGFTLDEPLETLGASLKLPPWYEERRAEIEAKLLPLD